MARIDEQQPESFAGEGGGGDPSGRSPGAKGIAQEAKTHARQLKDEVLGQARGAVGQVREQAGSSFQESKTHVADSVSDLARAFQATTDQLRNENRDAFADYTDKIARQVEQVSTYLRDRDARALLDDTEAFARRRPTVFLATAFTLGVLGARFLKSSERRGTGDTDAASTAFPAAGATVSATTSAGYSEPFDVDPGAQI